MQSLVTIVSRTDTQQTRAIGEEALEQRCVSAYPLLVSEAYARLLGPRVIDPLAHAGLPAVVANAEGATLVCRVAWLRVQSSNLRLRAAPCNDYHVCTLLDAAFRPFASIGTRTAGNARQELLLLGPAGGDSTSYPENAVRCPSELIAVVTHQVRFGRDAGAAGASPFSIEDAESGASLVDFEEPVTYVDALARVAALPPEEYFAQALEALHEKMVAPVETVRSAVHKSLATIANADRARFDAKGWTPVDHCVRDRTIEQRAGAVHAGYFPTKSHDLLEFVTRCDASGVALDSSRTYRVRFERWNEPPAHASWFLYAAPAKPARIDLVRGEPEMSITLGPKSAMGRDNWIETLPRPRPLEVRLILCWPSERARSEIWAPPAIVAMN